MSAAAAFWPLTVKLQQIDKWRWSANIRHEGEVRKSCLKKRGEAGIVVFFVHKDGFNAGFVHRAETVSIQHNFVPPFQPCLIRHLRLEHESQIVLRVWSVAAAHIRARLRKCGDFRCVDASRRAVVRGANGACSTPCIRVGGP